MPNDPGKVTFAREGRRMLGQPAESGLNPEACLQDDVVDDGAGIRNAPYDRSRGVVVPSPAFALIEVVTVAALVLAWFTFRYERHRRWRDSIDAAYGSLRAVHHGMVQGLTPGQAVGWGQIYFSTDYTVDVANERARKTRDIVRQRGIDQVLVVPTEPLAKIATATPQEGLITYETIAVANFALWQVQKFNQLVRQLTDFNTSNVVEITSADTDDARREDLAVAAMCLSLFVHLDGIGWAWSVLPDGGRGWYGALVEALGKNMTALDVERREHVRRWFFEWIVVLDALAIGILVGVAAAVAF